MPIFRGEHILFPGQLRLAVNADRIRFIFLGVWHAFLPIEDVIRAEMNQPGVFLATNFGEHTRRFGVDAKSLVRLCLAKIDIGKRGRINKHIEICLAKFLANLVKIREIELRVIKSVDVMFTLIFGHKRGAESAVRADDHNFHRLVTVLCNRRF